MARSHDMKRCNPPSFSISSGPGRKNKWYVLARMILASNSQARSRCNTPFTVACVPTGINTGVSIVPWAVWSKPARAPVSGHVARISNFTHSLYVDDSEANMNRQLQNARWTGSGNLPERGVGYRSVGIVELRVIEHVECVQSKFAVETLAHLEVLG